MPQYIRTNILSSIVVLSQQYSTKNKLKNKKKNISPLLPCFDRTV